VLGADLGQDFGAAAHPKSRLARFQRVNRRQQPEKTDKISLNGAFENRRKGGASPQWRFLS